MNRNTPNQPAEFALFEGVRATLAQWLQGTTEQARKDLHTAMEHGCHVALEVTLDPPPYDHPLEMRVVLIQPNGVRHVLAQMMDEGDLH